MIAASSRDSIGDETMRQIGTFRTATAAIIATLVIALTACGDKAAEKAAADQAAKAAADAAAQQAAAAKARIDELTKVGEEAVAYGLPLMVAELTKRVSTNVAAPEPNAHAPVNQFGHMAKYPTAADKDIVRMNVDTLYSFAFLDLAKEPIVLSVPDTKGRYYLMPLIDAWTNVFASPGKRTTGTKAGNFLISGPDWSGAVPAGMTQYKSPTNAVMIGGRTQANGPADYAAVHAIQAQYKLTPLSAWGKPYKAPAGSVDPNVDMSPPVDQIGKMTAAVYFQTLATLLKASPPPPADAPAVTQLAKIGLVPGQDFDIAKLDPDVAKALDGSVQRTLEKLQAAAKKTGEPINGWNSLPKNIANFGTDYATRAVVALIGFGANLNEDAIYPSAFVDGDGQPLNGANKYILHFDKGQTPPTNAFWSLTMYNAQSFFVDNPLNRYNIAAWMPLKYNKDGSLDIYIQHESPGKALEANWLPAPDNEFNLTNRIYWPKPEALDGTWKASAISRVK
jgi:hypothetical protein